MAKNQAKTAALSLPRTAGNEDTALLKWIALVCMVIDHVGAALLPQYFEMRIIGRVAFPLYIWCAVVGVCYTRSIWKYALRLLIVGAFAQPCYMLALNHEWYELNVFATLLLGVLGAAGMRERKYFSHIWAPILVMIVPLIVDMDYGWQGVLLILLMFAARKSRGGIAATMIAFCLFWGEGTASVREIFGFPLFQYTRQLPQAADFVRVLSRVEFFAILSLPLIVFKTRSGLRMPKWAGYAMYPGHLLIIGVIRHYGEISAAVTQLISTVAQFISNLF